jgi:hypothetical protein
LEGSIIQRLESEEERLRRSRKEVRALKGDLAQEGVRGI